MHVYENEPKNNVKLVQLMQQVQEYGQPPPEIIQEIAPGLEVDEEGVPKFQFPPMGNQDEDCTIT